MCTGEVWPGTDRGRQHQKSDFHIIQPCCDCLPPGVYLPTLAFHKRIFTKTRYSQSFEAATTSRSRGYTTIKLAISPPRLVHHKHNSNSTSTYLPALQMASPDPFYAYDQQYNNFLGEESLFVTPSPPPISRRPSPPRLSLPRWENQSSAPALARNPSFTLPRPVPSASINRTRIESHPHPDPTLYQFYSLQGGSRQPSQTRTSNSGIQAQPQPQLQTQNWWMDNSNNNSPAQLHFDSSPIRAPEEPSRPITPFRFNSVDGENYLDSTPDFGHFNFETLRDEPPSDTDSVDALNGRGLRYGGPENISRTTSGGSGSAAGPGSGLGRFDGGGNIDLTLTSPFVAMPRRTENNAGGTNGTSTSTSTGGTNGRKRERPSTSTNSSAVSATRVKRRRSAPNPAGDQFNSSPATSADALDAVDLVGVDNDQSYGAQQKGRHEEIAKEKMREELEKPIKLATTQCVICLDQMERLVVTPCGKFSRT